MKQGREGELNTGRKRRGDGMGRADSAQCYRHTKNKEGESWVWRLGVFKCEGRKEGRHVDGKGLRCLPLYSTVRCTEGTVLYRYSTVLDFRTVVLEVSFRDYLII